MLSVKVGNMYDEKQIQEIIRHKRKCFFTVLLATLLPMAVCIALIFLNLHDTLSVVSWIAVAALCLLLYRIWGKYKPTILFSGEIRGKNIKEVEYIGVRQMSNAGRYRPHGSQIRPPRVASKPNPKRDGIIRSTVYLREDDGNVTFITDLYKSATDVYEEGDLLVKYAGTKHPIVISRTPQRQPCPLCGTINEMMECACRECGLAIVKK